MTDFFASDRPHPVKGMVQNPEWDVVLTRRAELYLAERARRADPEREPSGVGTVGLIIGAVALVAVALAMVAELLP